MSYKFTTGSVRRGDVYFEDDRDGDPTYIDFGQDTITLRPSGSQILHVQADAVGINTTSPDYTLDVAGDIGVDQYIYHNGDANTHINFTDDKIVLKAGNLAMVTMEEKASAPHEVTINDGGNNIDFVVEDNSGDALLVTDASTSRVGIGVATPTELLTINAQADDDECFIQLQEAGADRAKIGINTSNNLVLHNQFTNKHIVFKVNDQGVTREGLRIDGAVPEVVVNEGSESLVDFRVESDNQTHMLFVDGGNDKIGIATDSPKTAFDVHHNPTSLANDTGGGEVVTFGTGTLTAGKLYFLNSSGVWTETDADAISTSDGLLGIALGSSPSSDGVLLRGFFDAHSYLSNFIAGLPVYISTTAASMDTTQPSGAGDIVRCVGYCTDTANVIYFNPESSHLELS